MSIKPKMMDKPMAINAKIIPNTKPFKSCPTIKAKKSIIFIASSL
jgi:hypothetical protein